MFHGFLLSFHDSTACRILSATAVFLIFFLRLSGRGLEDLCKVALVLKAGESGYVYQRQLLVRQQQFGPVYPDLVDIGRDVFAGLLLEDTA